MIIAPRCIWCESREANGAPPIVCTHLAGQPTDRPRIIDAYRRIATRPLGPWPRRCSCGFRWNEIAWQHLPYVGVMVDDVDAIELRNCTCGSTMGVLTDLGCVPTEPAPKSS